MHFGSGPHGPKKGPRGPEDVPSTSVPMGPRGPGLGPFQERKRRANYNTCTGEYEWDLFKRMSTFLKCPQTLVCNYACFIWFWENRHHDVVRVRRRSRSYDAVFHEIGSPESEGNMRQGAMSPTEARSFTRETTVGHDSRPRRKKSQARAEGPRYVLSLHNTSAESAVRD